MAPTAGVRRAIQRRASQSVVDSRWWYWIAAVPATFALWSVAVTWVGIAVGIGPLADPNPVRQAAEISLIAFGPPFLALVAVFPFAVFADASAIMAVDAEWRPPRTLFSAGAAVGPVATVAVLALDLLGDGDFDVLGWAILAGFLLTVPVAAYYLLARHRRVGIP